MVEDSGFRFKACVGFQVWGSRFRAGFLAGVTVFVGVQDLAREAILVHNPKPSTLNPRP